MFCPKCGIANDDSNRECIHCGTLLAREPVEALKPVKPMNRMFFLLSVAVPGALSQALIIPALLSLRRDPHDLLAMPPLLLGQLLLLYVAAVTAVMWFRAWRAIQDGHARASAAKAVGFLFIPFFNLYWVFEAFWGFAKDCNALFRRHRVSANRLPEWLFLLSCILTLASLPIGFVPVARMVLPVVSLGVLVVVVHLVTRAVNELSSHVQA